MQAKNITNTKLSQSTGIPEITIIKLKKGHNTNPTLSTMLILANFFEVTINDLINEPPIEIIDISNISKKIGFISLIPGFEGLHYSLVKITNSFYCDYRKGTILIVDNKSDELLNEDIVLIKDKYTLTLYQCIKIGDKLIYKSLLDNKYYEDIKENNIFGVIEGTLWKKS